jgi:hypothetical protein
MDNGVQTMAKVKSITLKSGSTLTVEGIRDRIAVSDLWLYRGILAIYKGQTQDEKSARTTSHDNGIGFNGADAEILSSFAEQIITRRSLSPRQREIARRKMGKYAGQLFRIAEGNI